MTSSLQNRVTPLGAIVANPARGAWTGNRGALAKADGSLGPSRWKIKAWITCVLHWKNNKQPLMKPRTWTPLFFLDEATALAAGHRPCAYCRRDPFTSYAMATRPAGRAERLRAPDIDARLHIERLEGTSRRKRLHHMQIDDAPNGTMYLADDDRVYLIEDDTVLPWSFSGYGPKVLRPKGIHIHVLTPPLTLLALRNGYPVQIDEGAQSRE